MMYVHLFNISNGGSLELKLPCGANFLKPSIAKELTLWPRNMIMETLWFGDTLLEIDKLLNLILNGIFTMVLAAFGGIIG